MWQITITWPGKGIETDLLEGTYAEVLAQVREFERDGAHCTFRKARRDGMTGCYEWPGDRSFA